MISNLVKRLLLLSCLLAPLLAADSLRFDISREMGFTGRGESVQVFVPADWPSGGPEVWIHFHGSADTVGQVWRELRQPRLLVVVQRGSYTSSYSRYFEAGNTAQTFLEDLADAMAKKGIAIDTRITRYWLSSFEVGYTAIRGFLRSPAIYARTAMVVLADGLHANSRPVLLQEQMSSFVRYARDAKDRQKTMVISYSEFDPQIYASTTKTANHIINELQISRRAVDKTDSIGHRTTEVIEGQLTILGYAGAEHEDHLKHFEGIRLLMLTGLTISLNP